MHRDWGDKFEYSLRHARRNWAGILRLNFELDTSSGSLRHKGNVNELICDLVAISEGYCLEEMIPSYLAESSMEEGPRAERGAKYEYYNVLWVEREEGVAYQKGCWGVVKIIWESHHPEWYDLVLG
jgi:hypothetical protein